ncbi:MAG: ribonuclease HII [Bacteroidota bacterium]
MLLSSISDEFVEAGCDEAGRGCLAGPVFAAAVILPKDYQNKSINDSKKLSLKEREKLREEIIRDAISWKVASVNHEEIDKINILNASFLAMHRALDGLETKPELLLIDGNRFKKYQQLPHHCIVKGDGKYLSIAAASILAKTFRDDYMTEADLLYPIYQWKKNMGYATKAHRETIIKVGRSPLHRLSFHLKEEQLLLNFKQ